jgi:magnesium-transporting ATPase (P-type)
LRARGKKIPIEESKGEVIASQLQHETNRTSKQAWEEEGSQDVQRDLHSTPVLLSVAILPNVHVSRSGGVDALALPFAGSVELTLVGVAVVVATGRSQKCGRERRRRQT